MDIGIYIFLWTIGGHIVSSQLIQSNNPLFTVNPLAQFAIKPNLSGDKHRISGSNPLAGQSQPLGPVDPPVEPNPPAGPIPPPHPVAPLVQLFKSQNDLSKYKHRMPAVNDPRPKESIFKPVDEGLGRKDALNGPMNAPLGPKDPVNGPVVNAVSKPNDPVTVTVADIVTGTTTDPVNGLTDATIGTTEPAVAQVPQTTVMPKGCPEYNSSYRRGNRLVLLYQEDRCEIEIRLKQKNRVETMAVRFRKRRQQSNKQSPTTEPEKRVTCDEFPTTVEGGTTFITTRPQQCKVALTVELSPLPTGRPTGRPNKRNRRRRKPRRHRRPVFTLVPK